jgi:hypothetical protein
MKIKAKQNARKWVKERIKLHDNGSWSVIAGPESAHCWQGDMSIRLQSSKDSWTGWFPVDDIIMEETS